MVKLLKVYLLLKTGSFGGSPTAKPSESRTFFFSPLNSIDFTKQTLDFFGHLSLSSLASSGFYNCLVV